MVAMWLPGQFAREPLADPWVRPLLWRSAILVAIRRWRADTECVWRDSRGHRRRGRAMAEQLTIPGVRVASGLAATSPPAQSTPVERWLASNGG